MFKKKFHVKGVTLVETILVVVIIAVALPVILKGMSDTFVKQIDSKRAQDYAYLFQEKMEDVVAAGYDNVASLAGEEDPVSGFSNYKREVIVNYVNENFETSEDQTPYYKILVKITHKPTGHFFSGSTVLRRRN